MSKFKNMENIKEKININDKSPDDSSAVINAHSRRRMLAILAAVLAVMVVGIISSDRMYAAEVPTFNSGECTVTLTDNNTVMTIKPTYPATEGGMREDYTRPAGSSTGANTEWNTYRTKIKNVIIEEGVTSIGQYAFADFTVLQKVTMANTVSYIGQGAFTGNTSLKSINGTGSYDAVLPSNLQKIVQYAFKDVNSLKNIKISNATNIGKSAFNELTSQSTITIYYAGTDNAPLYENSWSGAANVQREIQFKIVAQDKNGNAVSNITGGEIRTAFSDTDCVDKDGDTYKVMMPYYEAGAYTTSTYKYNNIWFTSNLGYAVSEITYDKVVSSTSTEAINIIKDYALTPSSDGTTKISVPIIERGSDSSFNSNLTYKNLAYYNTPHVYTIYVKTVPCTITYSANGGTFVTNPEQKVLYIDESYGELPEPTRAGYIFAGWYTTSMDTMSSTGVKIDKDSVFNSAGGVQTLYARWNPKIYTIRYDSNGGDQHISETKTIKADDTTTGAYLMLNDGKPVREHYFFQAWALKPITGTNDELFTEAEILFGPKVVQCCESVSPGSIELTLYAVWNDATRKLSFNGNGTELDTTTFAAITSDAAIENGSVTIPIPEDKPTRVGYAFKGWSKTADGKNLINGNSIEISEDTVLYAIWDATGITISFDANGAEDGQNMEDQAAKYNTDFIMPPGNAFTKKGYTFYGWSTSAAAIAGVNDSIIYPAKSTAKFTETNITLYAIWKANTYSINYIAELKDGGLAPANVRSVSYGEEYTIPENDIKNGMTRTGYKFKGWSLSTDRKTLDCTPGGVYTNLSSINGAVVKLYDVWEAEEYTIAFNGNGNSTSDSAIEAMTIRYGKSTGTDSAKNLPKNTYTKENCVFAGWAVKESAELSGKEEIEFTDEEILFTDEELITGEKVKPLVDEKNEVTLYAVWKTSYTVELITAIIDGEEVGFGSTTGGAITVGEESTSSASINITDGVKISGVQASPEKGYSFVGWKLVESSDTGDVLSEDVLSKSSSLADFEFSSVKYPKGVKLAACFSRDAYTVSVEAIINGSVKLSTTGAPDADSTTASSVSYNYGDTVYVRIAPDNAADYKISEIVVRNDTNVAVATYTADQIANMKLTDGIYNGTMESLLEKETGTLTGTYTIQVSFSKISKFFTITSSCGSHGSIAPSGSQQYEDGVEAHVVITPDAGYYISNITVNGTNKTPSGTYTASYTLTITDTSTVSAAFATIPVYYNVSKVSTSHGSFSLSNSGSVAAGTSVRISTDPDSGYRVKAIYVNDVFLSRDSSDYFTVEGDTKVQVIFEKGSTRYTITGTCGDHGSMDAGTEYVEKGDDLTVTITPDIGYKISKVTVDGSNKGSISTYTFTNVKANHTIKATFTKDSSKYTIKGTAGTGGTVSVSTADLRAGESLTVKITPSSGYTISYVTVDGKNEGNIGSYTFTAVDADHTISAVFTKRDYKPSSQFGVVNEGGDYNLRENTFNDVYSGEWYYTAVKYAYEKGLIDGTSNYTFSPLANASRATIVSMLYRNEGSPSVSVYSNFYDVSSAAWYAKAVTWASNYGIVNGTSATSFDPNGSVTREQFAAILYRYAAYKGYNVTNTASYALSAYKDYGNISAYARDAMGWSRNNDLITGKTSSTMVPKGTATRAEAATIIMRFNNAL